MSKLSGALCGAIIVVGAALGPGCLDALWDPCADEVDCHGSRCEDGRIMRCELDDYDACWYWSRSTDCHSYEGGSCEEFMIDGRPTAACVATNQACHPSRDSGCLNEHTYYECAGGFVTAYTADGIQCPDQQPWCVEYVSDEGRGMMECRAESPGAP